MRECELSSHNFLMNAWIVAQHLLQISTVQLPNMLMIMQKTTEILLLASSRLTFLIMFFLEMRIHKLFQVPSFEFKFHSVGRFFH